MTELRNMEMARHLESPGRKRLYNHRLFTEVAPAYDRITRILSFGRDAGWKRRLIESLPPAKAPACLDIACGTGDLCALLAARYPGATITGLDLTPSMLAIARRRAASPRIQFIEGDMGALPQADGSIDLLTGGYAIRNAPDLAVALREIARVLKPEGTAALLDFSKPPGPITQRAELALLRSWGGFWGWCFHRNPDVYAYIAESLRRFPDRNAITGAFADAGLRIHHRRRFFFGFMELLIARRASGRTLQV